MIRPLRRVHLWAGIGLLAGSVTSVAIAARTSEWVAETSPLDPGHLIASETPVAGLGVSLAFASDSAGTIVTARATEPTQAPDLLLYYLEAAPTDSAALPAGARFLGAVTGRQSPTRHPLGSLRPTGVLVLWSLGHGRIVGSASFPTAGARP